MTALTINTTSANTNAMLSLPAVDTLRKKAAAAKKYISYTFLPKKSIRKSALKLFAIDWDLNMNELEFE